MSHLDPVFACGMRGPVGYKLSRMIFHRACLAIPLLAFSSACRGEGKPARSDSAATPPPSAVPSQPSAMNPGWDESEAGPVILLAVDEAAAKASVVFPLMTDSGVSTSAFQLEPLSGLSVDLFDRSGVVASGSLIGMPEIISTGNCPSWPIATLGNVTRQWRIGFRKGTAKALPLDSLEGLASADSLLTTTELARLASALSATGDPVFQGLPFAVRKAYRTNLGATTVLVGDVVRRINEEANPREEHLLLIAERPSNGESAYVTAFHSRAAGSEEVVQTNDVLGAVEFVSSHRPAMLVSFDYEDGGRVVLIERVGNGSWKITWRSAYTGC